MDPVVQSLGVIAAGDAAESSIAKLLDGFPAWERPVCDEVPVDLSRDLWLEAMAFADEMSRRWPVCCGASWLRIGVTLGPREKAEGLSQKRYMVQKRLDAYEE